MRSFSCENRRDEKKEEKLKFGGKIRDPRIIPVSVLGGQFFSVELVQDNNSAIKRKGSETFFRSAFVRTEE